MFNCCDCPFIGPEDMYGVVPMDKNVVSDNIQIAINEAQESYIKPLLCPALYNELCDQIKNNTLTYINTELLCYIKKVHVRYAFSIFLFIHPVRVTKESLVRKKVDESEFVDLEAGQYQSKFWLQRASNYVADLNLFLRDNIASNPLYDVHKCRACHTAPMQEGDIF